MPVRPESNPHPQGDPETPQPNKAEAPADAKRAEAPGKAAERTGPSAEPTSGPAPSWRFRTRRDVCRGLETIMQLSLMGGLSPAQVKDLSGILRAIGALIPKDEAAGGEAVPDSLRELVAQNPQLLESLQHLLTEEQLRQMLKQQGVPETRTDKR